MSLPAGFLIIILCVLGHAFFAGSEMAFVSLNRLRLRHMVDSGNKKAILIADLMDKPEKLFGAILVGMNICVIVATTISTVLVRNYISANERWVAIITTATMFPLFMIFGEVIPKSILLTHAAKLAPMLARPLIVTYWILVPVVFLTTRISNITARFLNRIKQHRNPFVTREELKILVREKIRDENADAPGREMIYRIFDLEQTCALDIMVPLTDVVSVEENTPITRAVELMKQSGFSRLPVYREQKNKVTGILLASDLLGLAGSESAVINIVRPAYLVPETKPIDDILREMQQNQKHMAVVQNETGGISGILTNEDIIEEIVGEIEDEYDRPLTCISHEQRQ
jgi:magnesium and cobalt exporter, CNNM family